MPRALVPMQERNCDSAMNCVLSPRAAWLDRIIFWKFRRRGAARPFSGPLASLNYFNVPVDFCGRLFIVRG